MPRSRDTSSSGLIVVDGEIGVMKKGGFFAHTNFVFEVTCAVSSPEGASVPMNGHLYRIRTTEGAERLVKLQLCIQGIDIRYYISYSFL